MAYSVYELTVDDTVFLSPDPNYFLVTGHQSSPTVVSPLAAGSSVAVSVAYHV